MKHTLDQIKTWFTGLHLELLISSTPQPQWKTMWVYVGFTALCWIGGIITAFLPIHSALKQRFSNWLWFNAWIGIVLFFFRFQRIPVLGMDLWRIAQEVAAFIWLLIIIRYHRTGYQEVKLAEQVQEYKEKYLPKPKNR